MYDYHTPIRKRKTRILGLTIYQILLLGGLGIVQLAILVLALKYIVFASPADVLPTVTPIAVAPLLAPGLTPTPPPDLSSAVLTIDDLPAGFVPISPGDERNLDFSTLFPSLDLRPTNQFLMVNAQKEQIVAGWTFVFPTPAERENFDHLITHPDALLDTLKGSGPAAAGVTPSKLEKSSPVGELSAGWSVSTDSNRDIMLFAHKNFGGMVLVAYGSGQTPVIEVSEVAQKLDNRIMDVLVNGPIPTQVAIAFDDLAVVKLALEDLPAGFQAIPDSDLQVNETSTLEIEKGGMRVAGVFGFLNNKQNAEETVLGYTFLFTNTIGKAVMDQMLAGDELLDAMFDRTPTQRRQTLTINHPIGERAMSTAIMDVTDTGGIRCDVLVFRRGYIGAVLFHIYIPGRRTTTVEDLAVKLDKKIERLASP